MGISVSSAPKWMGIFRGGLFEHHTSQTPDIPDSCISRFFLYSKWFIAMNNPENIFLYFLWASMLSSKRISWYWFHSNAELKSGFKQWFYTLVSNVHWPTLFRPCEISSFNWTWNTWWLSILVISTAARVKTTWWLLSARETSVSLQPSK